jgi:hypothetical protein
MVTSSLCSVTAVSEVLSSDEDEIDETNQEYLEKLQRKITKSSVENQFNVTSYIQVRTGITFFEDKFAE